MNVLDDDHTTATCNRDDELSRHGVEPVDTELGVERLDLSCWGNACADHVGDQWEPRQ